MKFTEEIKRVDDNEFNVHGQETKLTISEISMEDEVVQFNPPLVVEGFLADTDDCYEVSYDFGMKLRFPIYQSASYGVDKTADWQDKFKANVKFDLNHAFFHISMDPNYGPVHYALFGCLCLKGRSSRIVEEGAVTLNSLP